MKYLSLLMLVCSILFLSACKEDAQLINIDDNNAPPYAGIPTILVENYVNRLYIDLIGREPTDLEMETETKAMKAGGLLPEARLALIQKLQSNTAYVPGDSSYKIAYYHRLYVVFKARMIKDGSSNEDFESQIGIVEFAYLQDSLNGNIEGMQQNKAIIEQLKAVLASEFEYRNGTIDLREMYARLLQNSLYDNENMGSFNFVRASFNDLLDRFPTDAEFADAFPIIEYAQPGIVLGKPATNKAEYVRILVDSREFHEGMIRWCYKTYLQTEPTSGQVLKAMQDFYSSHNLQKVQADILVTDEYAGFEK